MRLIRPSSPSGTVISGPTAEAYPDYDAGTTYALGDRVLYFDSAAFMQWIYESAQASNTGHAVTDPAWWILVGASNPYRMFDTVANSQTTAADNITTSFFATPFANTVAILNCVGTTATVTVTVGGVVKFTQTKSLLIGGDGVTDWYEYFFGDMAQRSDVLFTDLPSYTDQVITVSLSYTGNTVAIGTLVVGYGYYIGDTQYDAGVGINDYSRKVADDFGGFQIVERPYSKTGSFSIMIPNSRVDEICNLLPQYRAKPTVWIGADDFGATFIYGFYKSWFLTIKYVNNSLYTLEIEGLS